MLASSDAIMETADRDLERRVVNYLWGRHVPSLRRLDVEAANGVVTVTGRVRSFYEKQLCQHSCRRVAGVVQLIDEVEVAGVSIDPFAADAELIEDHLIEALGV